MIRSVLNELAWRMGFRLAKKHIAMVQFYKDAYTDAHAAEIRSEAQNIFWRRVASERSFDNGYHEPWARLGASDAANGHCYANRYRNHSYNAGWTGEVVQQHLRGWSNPFILSQVELMERLYWQKIPLGTSDEYYRHFAKRT